ncbi:MAG: UDP-2,4-diacetamido-2,4,6-trideoxy-beta-L-altropyranose hydrolase [Flavobacteriales bacterium]
MDRAKIHFRCDGGPAIGLGHLTRSLALAQMLDSLFEVHFHCIEAPDSFRKELRSLGYYFHALQHNDEFTDAIAQGDKVVIDHYGIGIDLHRRIRAKGAFLACIDDLHDKPFDADLIINHAPGVKAADYQAQPNTQFALGPGYALLRPEFLEAARQQALREANKNLLICFGGADFNNLSCQALQSLRNNDFFAQIRIITGSAFPFRNELAQQVKKDPRVQWYENQSATEMLAHMQACTFALAPASSIAYELLAAGCVWLGGYYVDNQRNIYEGFKALGAMIDMGDLNEIQKNYINLEKKLKSDAEPSFKLKAGSEKKLLKSFIKKSELHFRKAKLDDALLLFKWANDNDVRKNSLNPNPIIWEEHLKWYSNKINSALTVIYILEYNQVPLGQIRLDMVDDFWQIDYSIDSRFRGISLGTLMIDFVKSQADIFNKLSALVKKDNYASLYVFINNGFQKISEEETDKANLIRFEYKL